MEIDTSGALIDERVLAELEGKLQPEIEAMRRVVETDGYADDRASLNLLDDTSSINALKQSATPFLGADVVLLVGMGGPGLGARAVQEALQGILHNELIQSRVSSTPPGQGGPGARIYYLDTLDPTRVLMLTQLLEVYVAEGKKIVIVVATQSGTTTETVANFEHFLSFLEQHGVDPASALPVITNEGSKLEQFAHDRGLTAIPVPPTIGGRYSVFSPLGLFPLLLAGIKIDELLAGAREARTAALQPTLARNPAARSAAIIASHHQEAGRTILTNLMLMPDYESVGFWCRQIMAESLGKQHDRNGRTVHMGITPTVEVSSRDLHSMFQLHMEGPDDTLTRFVRVGSSDEVRLPTRPEFDTLVPALQGKRYQQLAEAITASVLYAYQEVGRPCTVTDLDGSVSDLGAFLQTTMMETMFLGHLLHVNPFDQPGVERYKKEMKKNLVG